MAGRNKRSEEERQSGRGNIVLAVLVVVVLLAVLYTSGSSLQRKLDGYRAHIAELEQQLEEEEAQLIHVHFHDLLVFGHYIMISSKRQQKKRFPIPAQAVHMV